MERVQFALSKQLQGAYDLSQLKLSEQVRARGRPVPHASAPARRAPPLPDARPRLTAVFCAPRCVCVPQGEELARQKRRREDVGVQLYQVQQQLAKLQMNLEKVHENHSIIGQLREQAEDDLQAIRPTYTSKLNEVKEHRNKHDAYQGELDQQ